MKTVAFYLRYLRKTGKLLIRALCLSLIIIAIQTCLPLIVKSFISKGAIDIKTFIIDLLIYAVILFIYNLIDVVWYRSLDRLGGSLLTSLRSDIYSSLFYQPYLDIIKNGKDKIKNILYYDTLNVFSCLSIQTITVFTNAILIIVFSCLSFKLNLVFGFALFLVAALSFIFSFCTRKRIMAGSRQVNIRMKDNNKKTDEYVDSLETARMNNLLGYFVGRQKKSIKDFIDTSLKADNSMVFLKNINSHFHQWAYVFISLLFIVLSVENTGELVYAWLILDIVLNSSQRLEGAIYQMIKMSPSFENVYSSIKDFTPADSIEIKDVNSIVLDDVDFSFDGTPLISNLTCSFSKGDIVWLKGNNGSGKTTMVKLLTGLLKPGKGAVLVNDINLESISYTALVNNFVYVAQDETLLNEDIKDYLSIITSKNRNDSLISGTLSELDFNDDDKTIDNLGLSLSGGQRKKLLFGKLKIREKETPVIIIDELENAMDSATRDKLKDFEEHLNETRNKHIVFVISHQPLGVLQFNKTIEL